MKNRLGNEVERVSLISVIVPVYNVEKYLDQCIESIIQQTYSQLEIILVNDGSTDNSETLCKQWEKKDARIRVISQCNRGLACARNVGVAHCCGEYLVFVDSDDWVSRDYIDSLYSVAVKEKADIVVCDFYSVTDGKKIYCGQKVKTHVIEDAEHKKDFLLKGHTCMWSKIYKRSFYQENHIEIPGICYEDLAVFPLLVYLSTKIVCIDRALYFYRADRDGSIMNSSKCIIDFPQALAYSIQLVRNRFGKTYLDRCILLLQFINVKYMQTKVIIGGLSENYLTLFHQNVVEVWDSYFENWQECLPQNLIAFGSFNIRWGVHNILLSNDGLRKYYGFTSLIAQFVGNKKRCDNIKHENRFRNTMIKQDWEQDFASEICNTNARYIFIDFMEEVKSDVILTEKGEYLTNSEALSEIDNVFGIKKVLRCMDEEYFGVWKQACDKLINLVDKYYDRRKVVLVKMRYANWYFENNEKRAFPKQEDIEQKNKWIILMEKYFEDRCRGICTIEIPEKYFYNNEDKYGKDSYYLNREVYNFIADTWFERVASERET